MQKIGILGSSGSIGKNVLKVLAAYPDKFKVTCLSVNSSIGELEKQCRKFSPEAVAVSDPAACLAFRKKTSFRGEILSGPEGLLALARHDDCGLLFVSVVGFSGVLPTIEALKSGKDIALANKEALVAAGGIIIPLVKKHEALLLPVDSEHNAIWQCLKGENTNEVEKIILTASGGPFLKGPRSLKGIKAAQALRHPRWSMGKKITIDSATLMNKGFEVIEGHHLFGISYDRIEVLIHPESVIHSMVAFSDGSVLAQLGVQDMKIPILNVLSYPGRLPFKTERLDLAKAGGLSFSKPDYKRFPCLSLAYDCGKKGGVYPAVLNAANEIAVQAFLSGKLDFMSIPALIKKVVDKYPDNNAFGLSGILEADRWAREKALSLI